ncbi:MAG: hypothetical protein WA125_08885, partial [Desulfosporosinus sp.]
MPTILINVPGGGNEIVTGIEFEDADENTRRASDTILYVKSGTNYIPLVGDADGGLTVAVKDANGKLPGEEGYEIPSGSPTDPVNVAGASKIISPTITVDTAAYAAGECVGGKLTLTSA